jgi:hypothetical protein
MTAKVKDRPTAKTAYEADYYTWANEQVELLKSGKLDEIDAHNIAEELADMGRSEFRALESAIRTLVMHILKWDRQPEHRTRSWIFSIREQRRRIERILSDNPGLRPRRSEAVVRAYPSARDWASNETSLDENEFPEDCPYDWDDLLIRPFDIDSVPASR